MREKKRLFFPHLDIRIDHDRVDGRVEHVVCLSLGYSHLKVLVLIGDDQIDVDTLQGQIEQLLRGVIDQRYAHPSKRQIDFCCQLLVLLLSCSIPALLARSYSIYINILT